MEVLKEEHIQDLMRLKEIEIGEKKVCVFGQGFVGLPLTLSFAFRGCQTVGIDIDNEIVTKTNNGLTDSTEKYKGIAIKKILKEQLKQKRYKATINGTKAVKECDNIIITVGIPIKKGKYIMDHLESACMTIGQNLKRNDLVIIRSTVIPGTTEEFILPILEKESEMKAGKDFYLAYSSERIAEGKAFEEFADMPTLVAGIDEKSCKKAVELLRIICKAEIIEASCIKAVETSKVFENIQRDVNIAMVQEFARFTESLGIDIFEVIKLANTHKRVNLLTPGPGVGGYCIPNAYHYVEPKANQMNVHMDILKLAREKNALIPQVIVDKLKELLKVRNKSIENCKVAVLGLSMKDYSNDDRISPPVDICKLLMEAEIKVSAFDPLVTTEYDFKVKTEEEALKNADAVLILAKQNYMNFDDCEHMAKLMNENPVCLDTKAVINAVEAKKYGFLYWRI